MNKHKILWFCRTSDSSSLSRITDSVIPILSEKFDITLLSNKSSIKGIKNVLIGSDTESITYKKYLDSQTDINDQTIRSINMKYILVQMVDLIYEGDYNSLMICNGIYEIDWFVKILKSDPKYLINKNGAKTKLVVWAPIDYIPTHQVIKNAINADLFLTMTPVMVDEIKKITSSLNIDVNIDYVGHGSDISSDTSSMSRKSIVDSLNNLRESRKVICKNPIKETDIIILNANNYGPLNKDEVSIENTPGTRKRLDITIKAFLKLQNSLSEEEKPRVKLWVHTNIKSLLEMMAIENILLQTFVDNLILSNNNLTDNQLRLIYKVSQISLQTSTGEGWSLTNLEAASCRSLQIVPDFLACGYHFSNNRGLLIPVTQKTIKNEGNIDVIIGEVSVDDTTEKLQDAIILLDNDYKLNDILDKADSYASNYTWSNVSKRLSELLCL